MPYVEGRWGKIGLETGEEHAEYQREKRYQQDKSRAMAEAQRELERERSERRADTRAFGARLDAEEEDQAANAPGALPKGAEGPYSVEEQRVHERFARIRSVASRMSPEHRERWLAEEQQRLRAGALDRARKKVAEGVQDRYQRGGFNLLDETEPNPAIDQRVQQLMEALDSDQIDPLKAAEVEAEILGTVRKENERRLGRKRGTQMIEQQLQKAVDSGNRDLAEELETIHAMWGTGELETDDLIDRMFEAEHGRKTARASAPNPFEVRKEALRLWETYNPGVPPTEKGLRPYLEMLSERPASTRQELEGAVRDVGTAYTGAARAQGELAGGGGRVEQSRDGIASVPVRGAEADAGTAPVPGVSRGVHAGVAQDPSAERGGAAKGERSKRSSHGREAGDGGEGAVRGVRGGQGGGASPGSREAAGGGVAVSSTSPGGARDRGGLPPRPWGRLKPKERRQARKDLEKVATKGGDLRAAMKSIGISDPNSVPEELRRRLISLAKKAGGPTLGEAVSHRRPGAGGM